MTQHADRRRLLALFCDKFAELVAGDDEMVGAFVVIMRENGRAAAYYTPIPDGQATVVVSEITKVRNIIADINGVTDGMLNRHLAEAARLDEGQFEGRA